MTESRDSDEGDSYEYHFSEDGSSSEDDSMSAAASDHAPTDIPKCLAVTIEELKAHYNSDVQRIREVLSVDHSTAVAIMRHYEWNVHKVLDRLGGDPQQLAKFGAIVEDTMDSHQEASYECPVCFLDGPAETFYSAACGHKVCQDCWRMYIIANIKDRKQIAELRCPALAAGDKPCPYLATRSLISGIVDSKTLKQLDTHDNDLLVQTNPNATFCPGAECARIALVVDCKAKSINRPVDFWCPCGAAKCLRCPETAHRPLACEAAASWLQTLSKNDPQSHRNVEWIMGHTRPCPQCRAPIEKNGGCNHMTCRTCGHHFDWNTGVAPGLQSWHESLRSEVEEAKRFTHCYTPWLAHAKSQELAAEQLEQYNMLWRFEIQDRLEIHDDQEAEKALQPLLDAFLCVKRHRQTLRWTYAYAYFAFAAHPANVPKMTESSSALFEFLQTEAVNALEKLSGKLERDLQVQLQEFYCDGLDEAHEQYTQERQAAEQEAMRKEKEREEAEGSFGYVPWGSGSTAFQCTAEASGSVEKQAIVMSAARQKRFWALLGDIQNMTHATRKYFEDLVKQLEVGLQDINQQFAAAT